MDLQLRPKQVTSTHRGLPVTITEELTAITKTEAMQTELLHNTVPAPFLAHRGANLRGRGYKDDLKPFAHLYLPASVKLL